MAELLDANALETGARNHRRNALRLLKPSFAIAFET